MYSHLQQGRSGLIVVTSALVIIEIQSESFTSWFIVIRAVGAFAPLVSFSPP